MSTALVSARRVRIPYTSVYIDCTCDAQVKDDCKCMQAIGRDELRRLIREEEAQRAERVLYPSPSANRSTS